MSVADNMARMVVDNYENKSYFNQFDYSINQTDFVERYGKKMGQDQPTKMSEKVGKIIASLVWFDRQ